ncbi:O-antigen polymerase [Serratia sp. AS12]|uniref:PglL family O-oligosaccharyltransferase n=1 Tax=Serratia TaxID=613 RepID=UPI00020EA214|nr:MULTISPECIES: Wzy polymerase domain-containing protein [Serratia]AEF47903.1 O-antigen polymerase [Serratia plymuthica AS9]AEF52855.1 O-antigen polymerase [Serratia sp. AS12]AEG30562.1 O-antigen polymerase [Serratia sp. AS13]UTN96544.1 Wzy polymerase domain-containing protein [Serratia plymuthica]
MLMGKTPLVSLSIFLLSGTGYYIINQGASGLSLPVNTLVWGVMALLVLFISFRVAPGKYRVTTVALPLFISGIAVLAIPLLYAEPAGLSRAGWRVAALIAGAVFYFAWLQVRLSHAQRQGLWLVLLLAVAAQAALALVQLFAPEWAWVPMRGGRVYGIFQQPNVLASFMATGLALALMLFLLPGFTLRQARYEHCRQAFLGALLLVLPALLVWIQSRVGWLGGALVALLFLWRFGALFPARCKQAALLLVAGMLIGVVGMLWAGPENGLGYLSHDGSNQARWTMLRDTLRMIAEKPLLGWGYGGFEYQFLHFRINQTPPTVVTEIANHPHNEILLWWVEGGLVALLGMGLIIAGGLRLVCRAWRQDRQAFIDGRRCAGEPTALCIVLLPMALHTQLEYPFYLSALHFMVFLLVLATLERQVSGVMERRPLPVSMGVMLRTLLPVASAGFVVLMVFALLGGLTLTRAERAGLMDITAVRAMPGLSAWVHQDRKGFDEQVHALLLFNQTQDEALLSGYAQWANGYLKKHIDRNVYASLYLILKHQGNNTQAERLRREALAFFPDDPRFM